MQSNEETDRTGRSSTGGGAKAGLMASVITAQPGTVPEDDGGYQTPRSPSFNDSTASWTSYAACEENR